MENAATGIINDKKEIDKNRLPKGNALILSGTGNNRRWFCSNKHLKRMEWHVSIIIIGIIRKSP